MRTFSVIWLGDLVSQVGSTLTSFAFAVYVYRTTGSVTPFAIVALLAVLPSILLSPFAGAWVDRWDRRGVMIVSSAGGAACTMFVAALSALGWLHLWHVYVATAAIASFSALYVPAYAAAVPMIVPNRHIGRANGLTQLAQSGAQIVAPLLAAFLITRFGLDTVLFTDCATYAFAVGMLTITSIPQPSRSTEAAAHTGSWLQDALFGFKYHASRPSLLALLMFFTVLGFFGALANVLVAPLVLSFGSASALATVLAAAGVGMLAGSAVMSAWGGPPRRRTRAVIGFGLLMGIGLLVAGLRPDVRLVAAAMFAFLFAAPIGNGCSLAIWQTTTPPDLLGRVLASRRVMARSTMPIAYLLAGPLADRLFDPLLAVHGALAPTVGRLLGVGPGRGIGLLFIAMGLSVMATAIVAGRHQALRALDDLPTATDAVVLSAAGRPLRNPDGVAVAEK